MHVTSPLATLPRITDGSCTCLVALQHLPGRIHVLSHGKQEFALHHMSGRYVGLNI